MKFFKFFKKQKPRKIRTRIAPSPTGLLHVGTARTALFNYIFARQNKGDFILRIEDTDFERSDKRFEKDILEGLKWLGIDHDEFYRQSERINIYRKCIERLLEKKKAFWCYHTIDDLSKEKKEQMQNKEAPRHNCSHKLQTANCKLQKRGIIRLKGSDEKIKFNDIIRGEIEIEGSLLGDIAIAKDEKTPLYNLAVVIDDYEMRISHVIRGEEHISNTPKQILIQRALNIKRPAYAHLPLILSPDRTKLSKRHAATSINEYKLEGYLAEALMNFMVFLGWNPGGDKEIISKPELIKTFSLDKIQKGGAIFNIDKLNWLNKHYIKQLSGKELSQKVANYIPEEWRDKIKKNHSFWERILDLEKPRLTKLSEIKEGIDFFFAKPNFPKSLLVWKSAQANGEENLDKTAEYLDNSIKLLSDLASGDFTKEIIKEKIWDYAEKTGKGNVLWPFRVALTGRAKSPDPFSVAEILGKKETLERLEYAQKMIYGNPPYKAK